MWTIGAIGLGVIVGWQFPQPQWAKNAQQSIVAWVKAKYQQYHG